MSTKKECKLIYLEGKDLETDRYKKLVEGEYSSFEKYKKRIDWYSKNNMRILVAEVDGEYVGQSCGYHVTAMINGKEGDLWWGGDTFVLSSWRGNGICKKLQKKLHEDLPNFSSVWYTPVNGIVKRKCGAKEILDVPFTYYPVSNIFTIFLELVWQKLLKKTFHFRINLPNFYYRLNKCFTKKISRNYSVNELNRSSIDENLADFMMECLKDEPFFIKRDLYYLRWKYWDDPNLKYKMLEVRDGQKRIGLVAFSEEHLGFCVLARAHISTIYDCLFLPRYGLSYKKLIMLVMDYYRKKGVYLDGVYSLQKMNYFPRLIYPWPTAKMLSTINEHFNKGYVTYLDQDMEQM